jgi:ElaB/YqjD/DUF883 family membrane-anchored ribosome-binding protein
MDVGVRVMADSEPWGGGAVRVLDYPTEPAVLEELQTLLCTIEALLLQMNAVADSELGRLRSSSHQALAAAQAAIAARVVQLREPQEQLIGNGSARVRLPTRNSLLWVSVALTGLIALSISLWAGRSLAEGW